MPRRFNWKQDVAHQLVDAYLNGKIQSARQLYNSMKNAGLRVSKNTVYSRVRQELREKRQRPRIALLAVPSCRLLKQAVRGSYRIPWQSQSVRRILDSYIIYKREKSLREVGNDIGTLFKIPPVKKAALKNHVVDRRRHLNSIHGPKLKKFDRLNFRPTDSCYFDTVGAQLYSQVDDWFKESDEYVKWDKKYDEPAPECWFQTVRSQIQVDILQQQAVKEATISRLKAKNDEKISRTETFIGNCLDLETTEPRMMPKNYKVRLIRHERQKHRSFIVEEGPRRFYHYVKRNTITAECSECREQWKRFGEWGQTARIVIAERTNRCVERVSAHHSACHPQSEAKIRQLEVERNVGKALNAEDELDILDKAEQMALQEIRKIKAELNACNHT